VKRKEERSNEKGGEEKRDKVDSEKEAK